MKQDHNDTTRSRLIHEADRIITTLKELESAPLLERSKTHPERVRESEAGRMYRRYIAMLCNIYKALGGDRSDDEALSPLREYIKQRMEAGSDVGND